MQSEQKITEEIDFVKNLKIISQSYQEISVMKIQHIRNKVIHTRVFVDSIQDIFENVKSSYKKKVEQLLKSSKNKKLKLNNKKDKEVVIFISANSKLYGEIVTKVFRDFIKFIENRDCEIMIIGKLGKELWHEVYPEKEIIFVDFSEIDTKNDQIDNIIKLLVSYTKVNVFYGKYESVITQNPIMTNITGDIDDKLKKQKKEDAKKDYFLFEPSIEELSMFFENQVITALMKQSIHESELSLHASRIKAMELALQTMDKKEDELHLDYLKIRNDIYNKNQQTALLGVSIWKK